MSAACGGGGETCAVDGDCASGFCKADGTCGPAPVDGGVDSDGAVPDGVTALCTPNHDGSIGIGELPFMPGRTGTFRVATDATWDTAGQAMPGGMRRWDLTGALANDQDRQLALAAPTGAWWAAGYPGATYASLLSSASDLSGVFAVDAAALTMLGVVSADGGLYRTDVEYDPPAKVLALPLTNGATWTSSSTVSGYVNGVIGAYTERYESRVDQVGTMVTPYGEFPVLRVATDMTRTSGLATLATTRTFTWVAECFGPVATASSQSFEDSDEFTDIAEVRRLAP